MVQISLKYKLGTQLNKDHHDILKVYLCVSVACRSLEVFPRFHQIPFSKMLTFYRKEPFQLEARYTSPEIVPHKDSLIGMEVKEDFLLENL